MNTEMNGKKKSLIAYCLITLLFIPLVSYYIIINTASLTESQENTLLFLKGEENLRVHYTEEELAHLEDVAKLLRITNYLFYAALVLFLGIIIHAHLEQQDVRKFLTYGGIAGLAAMAGMLLASVVSFGMTFTLFHRILFPQGNWQFPENSALITIFPEEFFRMLSMRIFVLGIIISMGLLSLGLFLKWKQKHKKQDDQRE